ncbi:hypothetical protein DVQ80_19640 [Yersinia enterocolitica]|nr:hypothetical protein [Yersinia enterocolitica]
MPSVGCCVERTLLHGDVLTLLMKTLLTSWRVNQRGAGHNSRWSGYLSELISSMSEKTLFVGIASLLSNVAAINMAFSCEIDVCTSAFILTEKQVAPFHKCSY